MKLTLLGVVGFKDIQEWVYPVYDAQPVGRPGNPVIDYRPNIHDFEQTSPIAGNYWPIASFARISDTIVKDVKTEMTVIPDRPHGGGSLSVGQLEIMVQRRVNNIDESERIPKNESMSQV